MLDTNTCSFLIRNKPEYLLDTLQELVESQHQIVISAVTYAELTFGAINKKAVEATTLIKKQLEFKGTPIGHNDMLIAGHCISVGAILVTDNVREFQRVDNLIFENWVKR